MFRLKKYKETRELCEIYLNPDNISRFQVGFVLDFDESNCLIASLNKNGEDDGFFCFRVDDIIKIQTKTLYLNNLLKLLKYWGNREYFAQNCKFAGQEGSLQDRIYRFLKEENKIASFEVAESDGRDFSGRITGISAETLEADIISFDGIPDGKVEIDKDAVTTISFDSREEKKLEVLCRD